MPAVRKLRRSIISASKVTATNVSVRKKYPIPDPIWAKVMAIVFTSAGAARRCSQKAEAENRPNLCGSFISNNIAVIKAAIPNNNVPYAKLDSLERLNIFVKLFVKLSVMSAGLIVFVSVVIITNANNPIKNIVKGILYL